MVMIKDGAGSGRSAKVDIENRLKTSALSENYRDHATELGNAYNINTGDINLTSANESAVMYLKNNEDNDLFITAFIYNLGTSTGGSGDWTVDIYRNPTTGTLISGASAVEMNGNQNFSSNNTLLADAYKGVEGNTITDGTKIISTRAASSGRYFIDLGIVVLPKGSSIGITVTPPPSNTSANIQIATSVFINSVEV